MSPWKSKSAPSKKQSSKSPKTGKKTKKPFRDIEVDGVTYSFLQKFTMCREQARLSYVEGLQTAGVIDSIEWGSAFHELLEHAAEGSPVQTRSLEQRLRKFITRRATEGKLKSSEVQQIQALCDQVLHIFPIYYEYWKKRKGKEFTADFVCQEASFSVPHHININGEQRTILIRGRFDAIFRLNGRLWLMENKTKSMIDEEGLTASLSKDMQTMLYCHAIRQQYGETPKGVLYNVIRRPAHRYGQKDTYESYLERMVKSVQKDQDKYFLRWEVTFGPDDLDAWVQKTLNPLLTQVILWWDEIKPNPFNPWKNLDRIHHFENPEALYTKFGRSEYFEYLTRGSTYGLRRRDK